jgi:hypothetical protein
MDILIKDFYVDILTALSHGDGVNTLIDTCNTFSLKDIGSDLEGRLVCS